LGGSFFESLPWVIAIGGVLSSLLSALVTERLAQGRRQAEQLALALDSVASANREMYAEQRSIAQTLQHALLPDALPSIAGLQASALYVPAGSGIDIGGDWYDIVPVGPGRALLLVGDVSGHGLKAATMMASTRHAALAYAAREHRPAAVLRMLSDFVSAAPHEHFATLLCILVDVPRHELTIATAGHPPPLLIEGGHGRFLEIAPGPPIGVSAGDYSETTLTVAPGATLLGFTDGLVERRGEMIDVGMERLLRAATARELPLAELMAELARILSSGHHQDDTAIMGVRWLT
jgi:serine phosphatase RsbU (regulator of sigma subunit)